MEGGIYPEKPISYVKIGMILVGSNPEKEGSGLPSLRLMRKIFIDFLA